MPSDWQKGLLGCLSPVGLCCEACWCPCIIFGCTNHRMKNKGNMQNYYCFNSDCAVICGLYALCGCGWAYQWWRRGEIRKEYQMEKACCSDCVASLCCHCCAIIQQEKEVEARTSNAVSYYLLFFTKY
ncbi:hypothetical protein F5883DRAFT_437146 [Diaporthe sp. PMI_573]|nr:hypothetical protein F5883DRAFT_437146 [Diaporthaceae sp. PMI_573]